MRHFRQAFGVLSTVMAVIMAMPLLVQPSYANETDMVSPTEKGVETLVTRLMVSINDEPIVLLIKDNVVFAGRGWKEVTPIDEGDAWYAIVTDDNDKTGYINSQGEWLIEPRFDEARAFSKENLARVRKDERWWFIDPAGNNVFNKTFAHISYFSHGYAAVSDTEYGDSYFIDVTGKPVFDRDFVQAGPFADNGLAVVAVGDKVPLYDITETETSVTSFNANIRYGYIDTQGQLVIAPKYLEATSFNPFNLAEVVIKDDEHFLIDTSGEPISDKKYSYISDFSDEGLARVMPINRYGGFEGFINTQGEELFELDYSWDGYMNGRILVDGRFFDTKGKEVIDYSSWAMPFYNKEVTLALRDGYWGILGRDGAFEPFSDTIDAPVTLGSRAIGFIDGIVPMLNDSHEISYFDGQGIVRYSFKPSKSGNMVLTDTKDKTLWRSEIPNQPIKNFLTLENADFIIFDKNVNYEDSLVSAVTELLNAKSKRYYIPNPLFNETDVNPYEITPEILEDEEVKLGSMMIVAADYVNEYRYGNFDFIDSERSRSFNQIYTLFVNELTAQYGKPMQTEDEYPQWKTSTQWRIGKKSGKRVLTLSWLSDAGDGDFYHQLVLEVND